MQNAVISKHAIISSLHIKKFEPKKTDKALSQTVYTTHRTTSKSGKFVKNLFVKRPKVYALVTEMYSYHRKMTLDSGIINQRILVSDIFPEYSKKMREYMDKFKQYADELEQQYAELKQDAKTHLNGAYREADYPSDIRKCFDVELDFDFFTDLAQIAVSIPDEEIQQIKDQKIKKQLEIQQATITDCFQRIKKVVEDFIVRIGKPAKRADGAVVFRDSTVTNVKELIDMLKVMNFANDPKLIEITNDLQKAFDVAPAELRQNDSKVADTKKAATEILNKMKGFM